MNQIDKARLMKHPDYVEATEEAILTAMSALIGKAMAENELDMDYVFKGLLVSITAMDSRHR